MNIWMHICIFEVCGRGSNVGPYGTHFMLYHVTIFIVSVVAFVIAYYEHHMDQSDIVFGLFSFFCIIQSGLQEVNIQVRYIRM